MINKADESNKQDERCGRYDLHLQSLSPSRFFSYQCTSPNLEACFAALETFILLSRSANSSPIFQHVHHIQSLRKLVHLHIDMRLRCWSCFCILASTFAQVIYLSGSAATGLEAFLSQLEALRTVYIVLSIRTS